MIRRVSFISLMLIFAFFLISLSLIFIITSIEERELIHRISRGTYSNHVVYISLDEELLSLNNLIEIINQGSINNFALIDNDYGNKMKAIYKKGSYDYLPIVSGRFFEEIDFHQDKPLAVIGQNRIEDVTYQDGNKYIMVNGELYHIIGVLGYARPTILDEQIIVNANTYISEERIRTLLIDSVSSGRNANQEIYYQLENLLYKYTGDLSAIKQLEIRTEGLDRRVSDSLKSNYIYILAIISYFLSSIILSFEWINNQKRKIAVKRLIGWTDIRLIIDIYKSYFLYTLIALILTFTLILVMGIEISQLRSYIVIFVFILITVVILTIPAIYKILKISVAEVLRSAM
ncbi:hypothetical protein [Natronospora cellulosivora (SeqCode)]